MQNRGLILAVLLTGLAGCSTGKDAEVSTSSTPTAVGQTSAADQSPQDPGPASSSGGGGGSGGGTSSVSTDHRQRDRSPVAKSSPTGLTPAEWRKQNYQPTTLDDFPEMVGYDEVKAKYKVPFSSESARTGKALYETSCIRCHGDSGAPNTADNILIPYNMAHLGRPEEYKYGTDSPAIFRAIAFGVPAPPHGMYDDSYSDQQMWSIANYVVSLQKGLKY